MTLIPLILSTVLVSTVIVILFIQYRLIKWGYNIIGIALVLLLYLLIAVSLDRPIGIVEEYPVAEIVSPNGVVSQGYWLNNKFVDIGGTFGCTIPKNAIIKKYDTRGRRMGIYSETPWKYDYIIPK